MAGGGLEIVRDSRESTQEAKRAIEVIVRMMFTWFAREKLNGEPDLTHDVIWQEMDEAAANAAPPRLFMFEGDQVADTNSFPSFLFRASTRCEETIHNLCMPIRVTWLIFRRTELP